MGPVISQLPAQVLWSKSFNSYCKLRFHRRSDAQMLACALLQLQWHPDSYLLGAENQALGFRLLIDPSRLFCHMLLRLIHGLGHLALPPQEALAVAESLKSAHGILKKGYTKPTRALAATLYTLDLALAGLGTDDINVVELMFGDLMITNEEFQESVYHSLRRLEATTSASAKWKLDEVATFTIPSTFGIRQTFMVDLGKIYPRKVREPETNTISYSTIILAGTEACLRSMVLNNCFHSAPLIQAVESWDKVKYVQ